MENCLLALNGVLRELCREVKSLNRAGNLFEASEYVGDVIKRVNFDYGLWIPYD